MQENYLKRVLMILFPIALIAFLIISISLTFGTSEAGKAMGVLEGCLALLVGLAVVYSKPLSNLFKKMSKKMAFKRKTKVNDGEKSAEHTQRKK